MSEAGARALREPEANELLAPVFEYVDQTVARLARKHFVVDPVVPERYSRITSIVSSAYKRHGAILERALVAALTAAPHLQVWSEPQFRVSPAAERLADDDKTSRDAELPYGAPDFQRTLQIDLIVYNGAEKRLGAYESKRGTGYHDSGKKRSMLRDLRCIQMLLRSYGIRQYGLDVEQSVARMVFYYGTCSVGAPWALTKADLDGHFGTPVLEMVEVVNSYFGGKLDELLATA
jgi:hypothetical protein